MLNLKKSVAARTTVGWCFVVKRKPEQTLAAYLAANRHKKQDCLLALDGVGNPHNLGAISAQLRPFWRARCHYDAT